ncbi:T9SS type A sorting domain-containing protein [Chryseobacterium sp. Tr-659]|uniref:DUF7948 domain-containing protein n=1 Tax=Chryseobacterium sp. Tr-659 TaxID=2608340 RepID=UPI00141EF7A1|nr:SBBP repeat-containing protein [Chryseobacterium sp. Tr-659]NIF06995.1 T9SS type A sorting domain-containing protein [Chryseobacterium sp. Tr-659]
MTLLKKTILPLFLIFFSYFKSNTIPADNHPLFIENKGQLTGTEADKVKYYYRKKSMNIYLMNNKIIYQFTDGKSKNHRIDIRLKNSNKFSTVATEEKNESPFFFYNDDKRLETFGYKKITFKEVYKNIDWIVYINDNHIKYDFVVKPGGNPSEIQMEVENAKKISLSKNGNLSLETKLGNITEEKPVSFQQSKEISTSFKLNRNILSFSVDEYDKSKDLIIDPSVAWSTYYGGNADDIFYKTILDKQGNLYALGRSSSTGMASGGFQNNLGGQIDGLIVKFNPAGQRLWSTYFGGTGNENFIGAAIDSNNNLIASGWASSPSNIAYQGHQSSFGGGGIDALIAKFDSNGNRIWSSYYGGTDQDYGWHCAVDSNNNVYLSGYTFSTTNIANAGHQNTLGGSSDGFLVKFNSNGVRQWGTYYGGTASDETHACAVDENDNVYIAGVTRSTTNIATPGTHKSVFNDIQDAMLVKFDPNGVRQWGTYFGGDHMDYFNNIKIRNNEIYAVGATYSNNNIFYNGFQNTYGGNIDAMLVKFNTNGIRLMSTYYGGEKADVGQDIAFGDNEEIYVLGETSSTTGIAYAGYSNTFSGGYADAFIVKFNGINREWGTYFGGTSNDEPYSITIDPQKNIYFAGYTSSTSGIAFNGFSNTYGGGSFDAFLVKFADNALNTSESNLTETGIYPNPVTHDLNLIFNKKIRDISLYSISGNKIFFKSINSSNTKINMSNLANGYYIIDILLEDNSKVVKKLLKK